MNDSRNMRTAVKAHAEVLINPESGKAIRDRGAAFWHAINSGITEEALAERIEWTPEKVHQVIQDHAPVRAAEQVNRERALYALKLTHYFDEGRQVLISENGSPLRPATVVSATLEEITLDTGLTIVLRDPYELPVMTGVVQFDGHTYTRKRLDELFVRDDTEMRFGAYHLVQMAKKAGTIPEVVSLLEEGSADE